VFAAILSVLAIAPPARAQEAIDLEIRGAVDPDSGRVTRVDTSSGAVGLDFGEVNLFWGQPRIGERIPARDGSGTYLVATLEVEVERTELAGSAQHERVSGPKRLSVPSDAPPRRRSEVAPSQRSGAEELLPKAGSAAGWRTAPALWTGTAEVSLRMEGMGLEGVEVRYAPGTSLDWGASGHMGTPLGPTGTVVLTARAGRASAVHQVALFLPAGTTGTHRSHLFYETVLR